MPARSLAVAAPPEPTFEEFLAAHDGIHAEWADGKAYVISPGNERQSVLTAFLASTAQCRADVHDLGEVYVPCEFVAPGDPPRLRSEAFSGMVIP